MTSERHKLPRIMRLGSARRREADMFFLSRRLSSNARFCGSNMMTRKTRWLVIFAAVAIVYLMLAYILLPSLWTHQEHEPGLASQPMVTRTSTGIPGDALNVGFVGSKEDVRRPMPAAGWFPADPITLRTSIESRRQRGACPAIPRCAGQP